MVPVNFQQARKVVAGNFQFARKITLLCRFGEIDVFARNQTECGNVRLIVVKSQKD